MPQKPLKACTYPGCPNLTREGSKCEEHKAKAEREYERRRGTATERGYDHQWFLVKERKLNRDPLCERCLRQGLVVAAKLVHHIDRNSKNNREENLESLCVACHDEEHRGERWRI